jgi:hypothetical protein
MMGEATALRVALELMHLPSQVLHANSRPIPDGMLILLRVAAGDENAIKRAAELTGRAEHVIREAAAFFIEQILFSPGGDSYRVLGANSDAASEDLRRNMILLLKWLHPDVQHQGGRQTERSIFARKVALAWDDLKTPQRRAAYDETQRKLYPKKLRRRRRHALKELTPAKEIHFLHRALRRLLGRIKP